MAEETGGEGPGGGGGDGATPPAQPAGDVQPAPDSQNFTPDWRESIADESLRAYVDGKKFKDADEAVKALHDLEAASAVPAKAEDYKLPVPEGAADEFAKKAASWMLEAGIPVAAGQKLAAKWNEAIAVQTQADATARQQKAEQEIGALKTEWGGQFEANVELGRKAMRTFGVPVEVIDSMAGKMGDAAVIKVFQAIGKSMSESTLNPGQEASSGAARVSTEAAVAARMFPSMRKPS